MKTNKLLLVNAIYNIISSLIVIFYYGNALFFSKTELSDKVFIFYLFILTAFLFLQYTNWALLFLKDHISIFIKYNIVFALLQIIHLKIFGLIFDFSAGIEIMPYIIIHDGINFGLKYDIWNMIFTALYRSDATGFFLGISLIPILVFISYSRIYKIFSKVNSH